MQRLLCIIMIAIVAGHGNGQKILRMELYSPRSSIGLTLKDYRFDLHRQESHYDVISLFPIQQGSFSLMGDTLRLQCDNGKILHLVRKDAETFDPVDVDSVQRGQLFLAWHSYFENGVIRQAGGWTMDGRKEGVWQYYDSSTARVVNMRCYKDGVLIKDHFKFDFSRSSDSRRQPIDSLRLYPDRF